MKHTVYLSAFFAGLMMTACEYKDIVTEDLTDRGNLYLDFRWTEVEQKPASMRVSFYPADSLTYMRIGENSIQDVILSIENTLVARLPEGRYNITCWNNNTEHVIINERKNREKVFATTAPYSPRGGTKERIMVDSILDGMTVLDYPDYMVHAAEDSISVIAGQSQVVRFIPDSMVTAVDIQIGGVKGLELVRDARGILSDCRGKRKITPENETSETVAVAFDFSYSMEEETIKANFYVFGMEEREKRKLLLLFSTDFGGICLPVELQTGGDWQNSRIVINIHDMNIDITEFLPKGTFDVNVVEWDDNDENRIDVGF